MWFVDLKGGFQSIGKFRSASSFATLVMSGNRDTTCASRSLSHFPSPNPQERIGKDPQRLLLSSDLRPKLLPCHLATLLADVARPTRPLHWDFIDILGPNPVPKMGTKEHRIPLVSMCWKSSKVFSNGFLTTLNNLNICVRSEMQKQVEARPGHVACLARPKGRRWRLNDLKVLQICWALCKTSDSPGSIPGSALKWVDGINFPSSEKLPFRVNWKQTLEAASNWMTYGFWLSA